MDRKEVKKFRHEYDSEFLDRNHEKIKNLPEQQKIMLNHIIYDMTYGLYSYEEKYKPNIPNIYVPCLSKLVRQRWGEVIKLLVPNDLIDDYYYIIDKMNKFQYSESYSRRSFRTADYSPNIKKAINLAYAYYLYASLGCGREDVSAYLRDELSEDRQSLKEDYEHGYSYSRSFDYLIAARIDQGDTAVIDTIKEMITSENNHIILTITVIRAVFQSSNAELHDLMCKLLVAARLSEGLRQAICENADCGTAEAFIKIVHTIKDENLIRFSAVKRAVATWTGICQYEDPDRIAQKILDDMIVVLEDREKALEYINTTDAVHIYMGLWAIGFYEFLETKEIMLNIAGISTDKGSFLKKLFGIETSEQLTISTNRIQLLTIGYFILNSEYQAVAEKISLAVIENYPEDLQLLAMFSPYYLYNSRSGYRREKISESAKLHNNKALAARHYAIMLNLYNTMPKKEYQYKELLFPWFSASISKSQILSYMTDMAVVLDDNDKKDFICERLTEISTDYRASVTAEILFDPKTDKQRETLINCIADKESWTRDRAVKILEKRDITDEEYEKIESFSRYKKADLREGVIKLLKKRDDEGLAVSITRMLQNKDENVRLAGLDLLKYSLSERKKENFDNAKAAASAIENPTEREEILINGIVQINVASKVTAANGYGLYQVGVKPPVYHATADLSVVQNFFSTTEKDLDQMFGALWKIIDENANLEYKDENGEEKLLGNLGGKFTKSWVYKRNNTPAHEYIPFPELWKNFYHDTVKTPERFWCLYFALKGSFPGDLTAASKKIYEKNHKKFFGNCMDYQLKDSRFDDYTSSNSIYGILDSIQSMFDLKIPVDIAKNVFVYILNDFSEEDLWLPKEKSRYDDKIRKYNYLKASIICTLYQRLVDELPNQFEEMFLLLFSLSLKNNSLKHYHNGDAGLRSPYGLVDSDRFTVPYYIKAYQLGIISKDILYKSLFELFGVTESVSWLSPFLSEKAKYNYYSNAYQDILAMEGKELGENSEFPKDSEFCKVGAEIANTLIDNILDVELKRGDSETIFSKSITEISCIYGLERFVEILKALGNSSLARSYYYYGNISKSDSLSHLLSVCRPTPDDNAEKLAKLMSETKIKNDRLIEVAMFAPQWIDIIQEYLKIDGFKSGCYYFMAHTAERTDEQKQAIIAKYTPLTREELNGGCFDVKWFNEAYSTLGDKMFNQLYKSAKYISSGNMHTRARKFADAALGKFDIIETENTIDDKRNKDLLLSLAVIPSKDKSDILQRYEFIQKFLKESKQFGAQRRASEGSAVQYALKNLAVTAGYSDETRLTLSMETELVRNNLEYFDWNTIGEYRVKIEIDKNGKAAIKFEKGGKALKSTPAAIKKDETFLAVKEFCDKLKKQYSRTVKMFELSMEERDLFSFAELKMLCENPVTKVIVENLVFVSANENNFVHGLISDNQLIDFNGNSAEIDDDFQLRTAHPFDLYSHRIWTEYQQIFFTRGSEQGTKQPFRQVFRELYVKLSEELDKERSLMFAGNQIQTKRTIGALRNRRWVADYEDGLQKIYYKDDIIATIYAVADWFSPSDIEAPVLESVIFYDRRTYKSLKIKDLPDILYSEIMRDVDLAVSVAHAGGVDPETSHSTVEMRKVILEFNLKLFGITNVTFEKNHALIDGKYGKYSIHLGSGVIHKMGSHQINVVTVSSGKKSKLFLPFIDEDPKTAEIMTKVLTFAQDNKIKDPYIMEQIK